MEDSFPYLADAGWPLDWLRWYMDNNIGVDELAAGVKDMLARGMTMEEIIQSGAPPWARTPSEKQPPPPAEDKPSPTLDTIAAADLQKKEIPPIRFIVNKLTGKSAPAGFHFATTAHSMDEGLFDQLEGFLKAHPDTGLIVIDTLQKVRGCAQGKEGAYATDYREAGALKAFADKHNVSLLVVHHLRKMGDDADP